MAKLDLAKTSKMVLFYGFALFLIIAAVDFFMPTWGLGAYGGAILVIVGSTVILFDSMIEKKKDAIRIAGMIVAALASIGVIVSFIGVTVALLESAKGFVAGALALFFIIEGRR